MTTIHRDDLTGEEYRSDRKLMSFGINQEGLLIEEFETHEDVYHEDPERVAERMHEMVDDWLADTQEWIEAEQEGAA